MDHSLYKILKYEFNLNTKIWLLILTVSLAILISYFIKVQSDNDSIIFAGTIMPILIFLSSIFTIHAYSESTSRQTMELYHLLPVSGNVKFFSKQIITFIIYPVALAGIYLIFVISFDFITSTQLTRSLFGLKSYKIIELFIWSHSISTFLAIVFKKRKILYAIATFFAFQLLTGIFFLIAQYAMRINLLQITGISIDTSSIVLRYKILYLMIPLILYVISYRLFFKRQL